MRIEFKRGREGTVIVKISENRDSSIVKGIAT